MAPSSHDATRSKVSCRHSSRLTVTVFLCSYVFGASRTQLSPLKILFAGGMGGVANWVVAIVPDTLKSRYQSG